MADKKVKYQDGVVNAELDMKDELHPEAVQPTTEAKRTSTKKGAEEVGDRVAT